MIRLVKIGDQITEDYDEFAFFDTVTDRFLEFRGEQVFESKREFMIIAPGHSGYAQCLDLLGGPGHTVDVLLHPGTGTFYNNETDEYDLVIHGVGKIASYKNTYDKVENLEIERRLWERWLKSIGIGTQPLA